MLSMSISTFNYTNLQKARDDSKTFLDNNFKQKKMNKFKEFILHLAHQVTLKKDFNSESSYQVLFEKQYIDLFEASIQEKIILLQKSNLKNIQDLKSALNNLSDLIENEIEAIEHKNLILYHQGQSILYNTNSLTSYFSIFISLVLICFYELLQSKQKKHPILNIDANLPPAQLISNQLGNIVWANNQCYSSLSILNINPQINIFGHLEVNFSLGQNQQVLSYGQLKIELDSGKNIVNLLLCNIHTLEWFVFDFEIMNNNQFTGHLITIKSLIEYQSFTAA